MVAANATAKITSGGPGLCPAVRANPIELKERAHRYQPFLPIERRLVEDRFAELTASPGKSGVRDCFPLTDSFNLPILLPLGEGARMPRGSHRSRASL
jgi:hypothetical protein